MKKIILPLLLILASCASTSKERSSDDMVSMQIVDRNGFSETISGKDRLATYRKTDFLTPQPYHKVVRVFKEGGKTISLVTSYHSNGLPWQYLEVKNGRAHGLYREWHSNGTLKIEANVIEGSPDISEMAQLGWIFDGKSFVWDEDSNFVAEISYEKGKLQGPALYYHPNGTLSKTIPYNKDEIDGTIISRADNGFVLEQISYSKGKKHGEAAGYWQSSGSLCYKEKFTLGELLEGIYYNSLGELISKVEGGNGKQAFFQDGKLHKLNEYKNGIAEGEVQIFCEDGALTSRYHIHDGKKNGDEWEYYPSKDSTLKPRLSVHWRDDVIQGVVKTWYENGTLESQREMNGNKKHGLAFAWYKEGDLMLMEEYEEDLLEKGSYYKKWEKKPITKIEKGKGVATLHDSEGHFLKKIQYEKGVPLNETNY